MTCEYCGCGDGVASVELECGCPCHDLIAARRESEVRLEILTGALGREREVLAALRKADELTLETQTIGEAVEDLVRLVREAREQRDTAQAANRRALSLLGRLVKVWEWHGESDSSVFQEELDAVDGQLVEDARAVLADNRGQVEVGLKTSDAELRERFKIVTWLRTDFRLNRNAQAFADDIERGVYRR